MLVSIPPCCPALFCVCFRGFVYLGSSFLGFPFFRASLSLLCLVALVVLSHSTLQHVHKLSLSTSHHITSHHIASHVTRFARVTKHRLAEIMHKRTHAEHESDRSCHELTFKMAQHTCTQFASVRMHHVNIYKQNEWVVLLMIMHKSGCDTVHESSRV